MNDYIIEGSVVIVPTQQSGCVIHLNSKKEVSVLLLNGDMWHGITNQLRKPQDDTDLEACPLNVEREEKPRVFRQDD